MAKPIQTWRNKGIDITAWPTNNGSVSFTIKKTYRPKNSSEYIESKSFFPNEIKMLLELLTNASSWADEYFGEEPKPVETRSLDPRVQEVVNQISKTFEKATVSDDDIPF